MKEPFLKKLYLMTALVAVSLVCIAPRMAAAQSTGYGYDGYSRQLYYGTDYSISLYAYTPTLAYYDHVNYGPYTNWYPVALATGYNDYSYVLWRNAAGAAIIWLVDPNLNYISSVATASYSGWTPNGLSVGTTSSDVHLSWYSASSGSATFTYDYLLNYLYDGVYPAYAGYSPYAYSGYYPSAIARAPASLARRIQGVTPASTHNHAAAIASAAFAMAHPNVTTRALTLPQ